MNGFFLKVIPKRKIAQHFKKCMVKIGFADAIQIIRAQTFLRRGRTGKPIDAAQELRLKLLHPRGRKQYRPIILLRDQRITGNNGMIFGFKET